MGAIIAAAAIAAAATVGGGAMAQRSQRRGIEMIRDMQYDLATQGIRYKVADAKAAGIHPLYALGAQTYQAPALPVGDGALGRSVQSAGQNLASAVERSQTRADSQEELRMLKMWAAQEYQYGELQNRKLALEVAGMQRAQRNRTQVGPGAPRVNMKVEEVPTQDVASPELLEGQGVRVPWPWFGELSSTAGRPSQQTIEDMYGGIVGELYGLGWQLRDAQNAAKKAIRDWLRGHGIRRPGDVPRPKQKPGGYGRWVD